MQKTVKHSPLDKLYDAWIAILAGAHGLVEINTRLRSDAALQQAFGRTACADQSTVQTTLNACTTANVQQLTDAVTSVYRQHSRGYRHDYARHWQLLDVNLTGMPCGRKAALSTKGYFATARRRRGRQLGRVLATRYGEVVTDQLFAGTTSLASVFRALVEAAEQVLELNEVQRQRTILRVDSGGGSIDDVNWALERGEQIHTKDYSRRRARRLGQSVSEWIDDPCIPGRQVGWVSIPASEYVRPVHRIAIHWRTKAGVWEYAVVISTLLPQTVLVETGRSVSDVLDHDTATLAYVRFFDNRGGGWKRRSRMTSKGWG